MSAIIERSIGIKGKPGFPTGIYFKTIGILKAFGYKVKKYNDWIEVNPRSDLYQEIIRKKQVIEQSVGRILSNISDMRRDIELIKHDLRKFQQVLDHFNQNNFDSLKSDYVDLVDSQTPSGMHKLVASGKFPTLVIDFFKIKSEKDIDKLKISESEKGLLKTKWMLFQEWMDKYSKAVKERVEMLKAELNNRQASLENQKKQVEPYIKAIYKLRITDGNYTDFENPEIIEGYNTILSGVELYCWKPVKTRESKADEYYSYMNIKIKKETRIINNSENEKLKMTMSVYLKKKEEIEELENKIKEREKLLWNEIGYLKGENKKVEESAEKNISKLKRIESSIIRILTNKEKIDKAVESELKNQIREDFIKFYDTIKDVIGGLKLKRHPI